MGLAPPTLLGGRYHKQAHLFLAVIEGALLVFGLVGIFEPFVLGLHRMDTASIWVQHVSEAHLAHSLVKIIHQSSESALLDVGSLSRNSALKIFTFFRHD